MRMVTPEQAHALILERVESLESEMLAHAGVLGRTLAQDIASPLDLPPFDNSAVDGYAVSEADCTAGTKPFSLQLIGTVGAGGVAANKLLVGQTLKIMTGAPIPRGAGAVVMREDAREDDGNVELSASPRVGENIRRAGSDVIRGEIVLQQGSVIGAAQWAMLASLGLTEVAVYQCPRVGIITTGAELIEIGTPLGDGQIYDSNSYALRALCALCGAIVTQVRHSGDSLAEFEQVLREVSTACDVVITSGGVSAGDFDPVRDVLLQKAQVHFWKIAMKPGKPVMFATFEEKLVFGLPGNPVSTMVAFEEFVRPALLKLGGRRRLKRREVSAHLANSLRSPEGKTEFVRAHLRHENGMWTAEFHPHQGSGRLSTMTNANALLIVPAMTTFVEAGSTLTARLIDCPEVE